MRTNRRYRQQIATWEGEEKDYFVSLDDITFKAPSIKTAVSPVGPI